MSVEVELLKGPAKGKTKTISDSRAKAFERVGYVRRVVKEEPAPVIASPVIAAPVAAEPAAPEVEEVPISPRTGRPVRQYQRRDLTAED